MHHHIKSAVPRHLKAQLALAVAPMLLVACGGGGDGAAVQARPQSTSVSASPSSAMAVHGQTTIQASASSGLPVRYRSMTADVCTVDAASGLVDALAVGTCLIRIDQGGDATYAPAATLTVSIQVQADPHQTIAFALAPTLTLGGTATVSATASSGLPVRYSSLTPTVCSMDGSSGLVTSITAGDCLVAADQDGGNGVQAAPQVTQTLAVAVPAGLTEPGQPQGVTASAGSTMGSVVLKAASVDSGGSAILRYTVRSMPAGIAQDVETLPATVNCPQGCAGLAFSVSAHNAVGESVASSAVHVITRYKVESTFYEPDTQPRNSIFTGSFVFDATTGEVSALQGSLTESMTGAAQGEAPFYDMTRLSLTHQLAILRDNALGGVLVGTFLNSDTLTFNNSTPGATDFWSPQVGADEGGIFYGSPTKRTGISNPGNAYALIFVNLSDPMAPLTAAQLGKIAYADCAPGGMMGAACMTGTSAAGYGAVGTMSGYPVSQTITRWAD